MPESEETVSHVALPNRRRFSLLAGLGLPAVIGLARGAAAQTTSSPCAEDTLDKIKRTGVFALGARQSAPPYGYLDAQGSYTGFATEIARAIHARIIKELNADIRLDIVPVTSQTRIPLLQNGTIDMEAGATVVTATRSRVVDFAVAHFLTSTELLLPSDSPVKGLGDLAGLRVGVPQGGLETAAYRDVNASGQLKRPVTVIAFPDHPQGFAALQAGSIDTYSSDGPILAGMIAKSSDPKAWRLTDPALNAFLQAFPLRPESSRFKNVADLTIVEMFSNGEWSRLYDKYFGPNSEAPFAKSGALQALEVMNKWPTE